MQHLNQKQKEAATHKSGPMLVIAGAGTGKTRVITERIAHILREGWAKPSEVLALTFTEKATAEITERVDQLMPLGYEPVSIKTFHGFCESVLRDFGMDIGLSPDYRILQGVQHWLFVKENIFDLELDYYRPLNNPNKFIHALISYFSKLKEELVSPEKYLEYASKKFEASKESEDEILEANRNMELARAYKRYQTLMLENNAMDFADLQYKLLQLFEKRPNILKRLQSTYKFILVDEYQDTNIAQNRIVDTLSASHKNIMVVGDDDQSIYKFRGAAISNILQFQKIYPNAKVVVLTENYRSNQAILDFAYASIQHNNPDRLEVKAKVDKKLTAQRPGEAESIHLAHCSTIEQEIEYTIEAIQNSKVPLAEIAVLFRTNAYAQPYVEAFKKANIPYQFVSERGLYLKSEIKDLIALLRILANPSDDISFYRVMRMPIWNISMELIAKMIADSKKSYQTIWSQIKSNSSCDLLSETIKNLLDYSKDHSVGETLYQFAVATRLYEDLLARGNLEADEQIINIASFFGKIRDFERTTDNDTVIDFVAYLDMAEESGENPAAKFEIEDRDSVFVSTVHGAKGLEFNTVFLPSLTGDRFPFRRRRDQIEMPNDLISEILNENDAHTEEERRLFYVAVTRAKEALHLLHSDYYNPSSSTNPRKKKRSRFIDEVIDDVVLTQVERTTSGVEKFLKPKSVEVSKNVSEKRPKITSFSFSRLSTFETCPRQYEYQYILNIPLPPSANMNFGISLHNTLQEFYKRVMQNKQTSLFEEYKPDTSLENLYKIYDEKWIDRGYESKVHMETRKKRGKEILAKFYEHFMEKTENVKFLEKAFKIKIGDYMIGGRVDRVDELEGGTAEIIDYKTGKPKSQKDVDKDMQLLIYAMASENSFGIPASLLTLYFLDSDERVSTKPTAEAIDDAKLKIVKLADRINASDFEPTPDKFKCKYCPFNKICDAAVR